MTKKHIFIFLVQTLMFGLLIGSSSAQVVHTKNKLYKKSVKQKTKALTRQGYIPKGVGNTELHVQKAINLEYETDEQGESKNFVIYTSALGPSFEAAVHACRANARVALAGNIETSVGELVKRSLGTDEISAKSANGINSVISAGKQLISQKVSMEDIYIFYREVIDENDGKSLIEVEFAAFYSKRFALMKAQEYLRKEMKNETESLHKELDLLFKE